jgi:hypothetical protein
MNSITWKIKTVITVKACEGKGMKGQHHEHEDQTCHVVLYEDDTSIIITSLNPTNCTNSANKILQDINKWFTTNLLSLNADKTQYMQFVTKTSSLIDLRAICKIKEVANICNTKFLGLTLDNTFSWKNHIDTIVSKLSSACFVVSGLLSHFYPKNP